MHIVGGRGIFRVTKFATSPHASEPYALKATQSPRGENGTAPAPAPRRATIGAKIVLSYRYASVDLNTKIRIFGNIS